MYACFFFLMIRRPPRSTLFPTRRSSDLIVDDQNPARHWTVSFVVAGTASSGKTVGGLFEMVDGSARPTTVEMRRGSVRSEEHTSELQSRPHLVCRLLLAKKNMQPAVSGN